VGLVETIRTYAEPIQNLDAPNLDGLIERIGDSRVVLLGEATHGTAEFYKLRAEISLRLIREKNFGLIGLEADWPDVEGVNEFIRWKTDSWDGFHRFPEWMWRNTAFSEFADLLRSHNQSEGNRPVSIFGLDLYSLHASLDSVLQFLKKRDPEKMKLALAAHDCLSRWQEDPTLYGLAVWNEQIKTCEDEVFKVLRELHAELSKKSSSGLMSAAQNARVVKNAEAYYRIMYEGSVESWNLRDQHMFDTINFLLEHHGPESKIIVWEHNSHIGNALATQMGAIGEHNVGQLVREKYGDDAYLVGFMTDHGTVAAASSWGGPMQVKSLQPTRSDSYETLFHQTGIENFFLPLRNQKEDLIEELKQPRLERAVGVLYLPQSERSSHYFKANLPEQFDEICWIDNTTAVTPTEFVIANEEPDTYPFGI
jgi:erythromycin esterase-like protein